MKRKFRILILFLTIVSLMSVNFITQPIQAQTLQPTIPLFRMFHPGINQHLWTTCANEYHLLAATRGWNQEGIAWQTPSTGRPVHRLFHEGIVRHHYTADQNEIRILTQRGWNDEGPLFYCAEGEGGIPMTRLFHEGALKHLHTADANEVRELANQGWNVEGISFFGLRTNQCPSHTWMRIEEPVPTQPMMVTPAVGFTQPDGSVIFPGAGKHIDGWIWACVDAMGEARMYFMLVHGYSYSVAMSGDGLMGFWQGNWYPNLTHIQWDECSICGYRRQMSFPIHPITQEIHHTNPFGNPFN